MSNLKKTHELIRQNEQIVKKSQKHDANLQKNSTLYFQIGLIVCLLAAYGLFEMNFETTISTYAELPPLDEPTYVDVPLIKPVEPTFDEPIKKKQNNNSQIFEEVPNDTPELFFEDEPKKKPSENVNPPIDSGDLDVIEEPEDIPIPVAFVQKVPIYPGCEKSKNNKERRQCMSEKISKLIRKKFDGSIASDYGLSGKQRINVQFKIDKTGHVTDIKTRAPHPKLKKEAERVINKIPEMIPGKQNNKSVGVIYTLPIIFQVN